MSLEKISTLDFTGASYSSGLSKKYAQEITEEIRAEQDFIPVIKEQAKQLSKDLDTAKRVYYPLGQSDIITVMSLCKNATNITITGADGAGATSISKVYTPKALCRAALNYSNNTIFNYTSSGSKFVSDIGRCVEKNFPNAPQGDTYPTLLLMAASLHNRFGINNFEIHRTQFGYSLNFTLDGKKREVEYVNFRLQQDPKKEDRETRKYLTSIKADVLINKAIPFRNGLSMHPSATAVLTGATDDDALVISDISQQCSFDHEITKKPTDVFKQGLDETVRRSIDLPEYTVKKITPPSFFLSCIYLPKEELEIRKPPFGYGSTIFLTKGSGLIPLTDIRRAPDYIQKDNGLTKSPSFLKSDTGIGRTLV